MTKARSPLPDGFHSVTPQLVVDDAAAAIDWYKKAIGAEEKMRALAPNGQVMHAELQIGNSRLMVNDPIGGGRSPRALGGTPVGFWIYVDDCDALFNQALANGAEAATGPMGRMADQFWGDRTGTFTDPFGYRWTIATRKEDLTPEELDRRAQEFFKRFGSPA